METRQDGTSATPGHLRVTGRGDLFDAACPTRLLLDRIGSKWTAMLVLTLAASPGPVRFGALRRSATGISQKMLTQTLRSLEDDGLVLRQVAPTRPLAVSYSLTPLGDSLVPVLGAVREWAEAHMAEVDSMR